VSADGPAIGSGKPAPGGLLTLGPASGVGEDEFISGLTIHGELGHGAHAVVYRARRYGCDYALKVLRASAFSDASTLTAFHREAALLSCVQHPGVVAVHEAGQVRGRPYLVMELVEGHTLAEAMLTTVDEGRAIAVATDVAEALGAAHRAGLTHRDVKPHNIMILPDGRAKLIDFGLAAIATEATDSAVAGTFAYSAPEQTGMLNRLIDGRSDLYSLGVVLFHCLTGRLPFEASEVGELLRQHTVQAPPDVRQLRPEVSAPLAAVIAKLLAKDPDDRYQSGDGLAADLRAVTEGVLAPDALGRADTLANAADAALLGRDAELAQLTNCWSKARAGRGGLAVVAGSAGAGKSRLVREVLSEASDGGHLTLRGKCSPDDPMPMSPIRSAVERYLADVERLPAEQRQQALDRIHRAAGRGAALLGTLSPALAALLDAPELADEHRQEQFAVSVATFLVGLSREFGAAVLCIDDVQWLDAGTHRVLHHLTGELADSSLLVLATSRDDADSRAAYESFLEQFTTRSDAVIVLSPLSDAAMTKLLTAQLGGAQLTAELTAVLTARSGGNPFTAQEYVRAIIDGGLIRPSWGTWKLDEQGLDALHLPDNVLDLIGTRVAGLGAEIRELLVAAAASAMKIRSDVLARICDVPEHQVQGVLRLAIDRRLIADVGDGQYTFLHDRIREALLADVDPCAMRALHQRIAEALDGYHPDDAEHVYAVARHYELGEPHRNPVRAYRSAIAAGRLALAKHAPDQTLAFLQAAEAAAEVGGIDRGIDFHEPYGIACVRVGRFADARVHLDAALTTETDPTRRAMLRALVCESYQSDWEMSKALSSADDALAEIGRDLPKNPIMLVLSTVVLFLASLFVKWTGIGYGTTTGERRERTRVEATILAQAAQAAASGHRLLLVACLQFRQLYPANRLGHGPEYVKAHVNMAGIAKIIGLHRFSARQLRQVSAVAAELGDPRVVAYIDWIMTTVQVTQPKATPAVAAGMRRVLTEHGRWLDAQETFNAASILCTQLTNEGHTAEAQAWYERVKASANQVEPGPSHHLTLIPVPIRAIAGRGDEAERQLDSARDFLASTPDNREQLVGYLMHALVSAVELGHLGERFEELVRTVETMRLTARNTWPPQHQIWASIAYGRLMQAQVAPQSERPACLRRARVAVRQLRRAAATPLLKVHRLVAEAYLAQISGDPARALRLLERAERRARRVDAPVLYFEISRVQARALHAIGSTSRAHQHARLALQLANDGGWHTRARAVQVEFGLGRSDPRTGTNATSTVTTEVYRRRLEALQQVSLAAATVLDPRELARIALQETIRIVGAERAFLFLVDADTEQLVPYLGRDSAGADLEELTGYGASLVSRVRQSGEPLVVTGTQEGEAHGSQSALVHGLRSILIAPLRLKGRQLGVVYLDSRVAKGIFTGHDVEILMAITNHIAVSLETARAAQLEATVRAASQQRDLAELLRSSMTEVSATLEPDEVLRRLLGAVTRALPGDSACLLRQDGEAYVVVDVFGTAPEQGIGRRLDRDEAESVAILAGRSAPVLGRAGHPAPPAGLLPSTRSWVAVPLSSPRTAVGVLLVASASDGTYTDAHLQIAAALAGQGMTAYDNAELFVQVTRLATVDAMTGVANRRHFLALADDAGSSGGPLTAIMLDIDHFKRVNDTYGHLVGDTVIQEVGARLRNAIRDGDLLGRYGGEEFALVVTAGRQHAEEVAERLLDVVRRTPIETTAGPLHVTVSVGMAHSAHTDTDLGALLGRADEALYQAKQTGRNRLATA
jgi:diguanylate cyclase (GGDEF)-like protein